jgi:hypothetical protein
MSTPDETRVLQLVAHLCSAEITAGELKRRHADQGQPHGRHFHQIAHDSRARDHRRHCCVASAQGKLKSPRPLGSDRQDQFVERDHQPPIGGLLDRQFVVSAPKVLDEGVPGDDHSGAAVLLEPSHWSQTRLQPSVIRLDPVVRVLLGSMPRPGRNSSSKAGYTGA